MAKNITSKAKKDQRRPRNGGVPQLRDLHALAERIRTMAPPTLEQIAADPSLASTYVCPRRFNELPISSNTLQGLEKSSYHKMTPCQRLAIPHALAGRDIVLAAKTGSGKTLAFVVPLLESLYRAALTPDMGLGAIIVAPTQELCVQLFDTLNKVGNRHTFSAGLLGMADFAEESARLARMNIIVGTPTRVLQHITACRDLNTAEMRYLAIDEADACLAAEDSAEALREIGQYFNAESTQIILASATLCDDVTTADAVRGSAAIDAVCLKDPEYINVHAAASTATPATLTQRWVQVSHQNRLSALYSFLRSAPNKRVLVFVATRKEARFLESVLRRLQPGMPVASVAGGDKAAGRLQRLRAFDGLRAGCLIATDMAARGLDFNHIHAVIQYDCAESVGAYLHRVGRTARAGRSGNAIAFLSSNEAAHFLPKLAAARVTVEQSGINNEKLRSVQSAVAQAVDGDLEIRQRAIGALESLIRYVGSQPDQEIFNVKRINVGALAESWGIRDVQLDVLSGDELAAADAARAAELAAKLAAKKELAALQAAEEQAAALEAAGEAAAAEAAREKALAAAAAATGAEVSAEQEAEESSSSEYEYAYEYYSSEEAE